MKKRFLSILLLALFLSGCSAKATADKALQLRAAIQQAETLEFSCTVTADYNDSVFVFSMDCVADRQGKVEFTVTEPASIAGISGVLSSQGGKITFDGTALDFGLLNDALPTPISAPYTLLEALRGGNIRAYSKHDGVYHMVVDESYYSDSLQIDAYFSQDILPFYAEVSYQGRKLLSVEIESAK